MVGRRLFSWLLDVPTPPEPASPGRALLERVTLELEPIYPNGATGALVRMSALELVHRATTDDDDERALWPAVFEIPTLGARSVRVRLVTGDGHPPIYAGDTIAADPERMPPAGFVGPR